MYERDAIVETMSSRVNESFRGASAAQERNVQESSREGESVCEDTDDEMLC